MASVVAVGIGLAAVGFLGRFAMKSGRAAQGVLSKKLDSFASSKYYKGGFEPTMSKREASLILGVSPSADKAVIAKAAKRIHLLNHPDKGGSPYLAFKVGEASEVLKNK